ncbi:hypothetical protein [Treponema sp.]|uniref:hypothetical protein n=1 Tax=Treponema sp. TaxID=166 RepID=UPI003F049516
MRLSVFVNTEQDAELAHKIRIMNLNSGLEWNCTDPVKFEDKNGLNWAGCASISSAEKTELPAGAYVLIYTDKSENESEISFSVEYPEEFLELTSVDFPVPFDSLERKIAVYSSDDVLLYYGTEKKDWTDRSAVLMDYKNAAFVRVCYCLNNDSVVCLMPPENVGF